MSYCRAPLHMRLCSHVHDHYQVQDNSFCDSWQNRDPAIKVKSTGNSSGRLHQHDAKKVLRIILHLINYLEHWTKIFHLQIAGSERLQDSFWEAFNSCEWSYINQLHITVIYNSFINEHKLHINFYNFKSYTSKLSFRFGSQWGGKCPHLCLDLTPMQYSTFSDQKLSGALVCAQMTWQFCDNETSQVYRHPENSRNKFNIIFQDIIAALKNFN